MRRGEATAIKTNLFTVFADGRAAPSRGEFPSCLHVSTLSVISSHTFFPQLLSPSLGAQTHTRTEVGSLHTVHIESSVFFKILLTVSYARLRHLLFFNIIF